MTAAEAEIIIKYYADIAGQQRAIVRERMTLDAEYNPLRGNALDGMPHAAGNGDQDSRHGVEAGGHGHGQTAAGAGCAGGCVEGRQGGDPLRAGQAEQ